jgi:hypothetical protein
LSAAASCCTVERNRSALAGFARTSANTSLSAESLVDQFAVCAINGMARHGAGFEPRGLEPVEHGHRDIMTATSGRA